MEVRRAAAGHRKLQGAALAAAGLLVLAFCMPAETTCVDEDAALFDVAGSCGPAGPVTLSYSGARKSGPCNGPGCYGFLVAPGANAVGLPEQGEADGEIARDDVGPRGRALLDGQFALVGLAPVSGASPPTRVERRCRAARPRYPVDAMVGTVLAVTCEGDVPAAACTVTLTFRGAP